MLRIILILSLALVSLPAFGQSDTSFTATQREYLERVAQKIAEEKQAQSELSNLRERVVTQNIEIAEVKKKADAAAKTAESADSKANVIIGIMVVNLILALILSAGG